MITLSQEAIVEVIVGGVSSTFGLGQATNISLDTVTNKLTIEFQIGSTNGVFIPASIPQGKTRVTVNLTTGAWSGGGKSGNLSQGQLTALQTDSINFQNDSESAATALGIVLGTAVATALPPQSTAPAPVTSEVNIPA
jgi:hypothetical protein